MGMMRERVELIVNRAEEEGKSPIHALFELSRRNVPEGAPYTDEALKGCAAWMEQNGEPTFDELLSWASGYDCGNKDGVGVAVKAAEKTVEYVPGFLYLSRGEKSGAIRLEYVLTGEVYLAPYTDRTLVEAKGLAETIRKSRSNDPRDWKESYQRIILSPHDLRGD